MYNRKYEINIIVHIKCEIIVFWLGVEMGMQVETVSMGQAREDGGELLECQWGGKDKNVGEL